jgi:endonuclease/exonuclease/phosphatase (EEP) superfamily protein YafD
MMIFSFPNKVAGSFCRVNSVIISLVIWSVCAGLLLSGCSLKIPPRLYSATGQPGTSKIESSDSLCRKNFPLAVPETGSIQSAGLDSDGFKLLNWNIHRGSDEGWAEDFEKFIRNADIVVVQEGYLSEDMLNLLREKDLFWILAEAFEYKGITAGVLTASKSEPDFSCVFRDSEPVVQIPKTAMLTMFPLKGSNKTLLVANIHMINFSLGTTSFRAQLETLARLIRLHSGPVIVAGDFNTWKEKRQLIVAEIFGELELQEIDFPGNNRTVRFGHILDWVYYRGLNVDKAEVFKVNSSDHNPMQVGFSLPVGGQANQ